MKKNLLLVLGLMITAIGVRAQNSDEKAVKEVIERIFKAMERGDSAMLHSAFHPTATGATIVRDKSGNPVLRREESMDAFYKMVGTPHKEVFYEEIWNVKVDIDGDFAQAWCDYAFYVDKNFSHCGADAFQLIKNKNGEWKIFHLADTRRREGCNVPQEIKDRRTK